MMILVEDDFKCTLSSAGEFKNEVPVGKEE